MSLTTIHADNRGPEEIAALTQAVEAAKRERERTDDQGGSQHKDGDR